MARSIKRSICRCTPNEKVVSANAANDKNQLKLGQEDLQYYQI